MDKGKRRRLNGHWTVREKQSDERKTNTGTKSKAPGKSGLGMISRLGRVKGRDDEG